MYRFRRWQGNTSNVQTETTIPLSWLSGDEAEVIRNLKPDGGKSLAELEGAAFLRGRDESDGDWNEKVALPLRARIAELLLMHELMACGHQKAYWVPDHFFSAMKPCDEPYDVYRCEICKRKVGVHTDGGGTAWIMNAYCSACQREKELVEECISIVIYTPSRHDDFVRADIVDAIRAKLGVK